MVSSTPLNNLPSNVNKSCVNGPSSFRPIQAREACITALNLPGLDSCCQGSSNVHVYKDCYGWCYMPENITSVHPAGADQANLFVKCLTGLNPHANYTFKPYCTNLAASTGDASSIKSHVSIGGILLVGMIIFAQIAI